MPRKRAAENCKFLSWLTEKKTGTGEGRFIQVGNSLFLSKYFQALSPGAQMMYMYMTMEAGGDRTFDFTNATMAKYNIPLRTGRRYIEELYEHCFIDIDGAGATRTPNHYTFSFEWKDGKTRSERHNKKIYPAKNGTEDP